jgi:hypothetical protein
MITSNGKRVFAQVNGDLLCYTYDEKDSTWSVYGAHYQSSSTKDGKVVVSNESDTIDIGFTNNASGSRVVAHEMGSQDIALYEINLKTLVWNKRQTISNVENSGTSNGSYAMDFDGDNLAIYTTDSSGNGNVRYYSFDYTTSQYDLKFTISNASGISNSSSIRRIVTNKDGSRIIISDTNGSNGSLGGDGNGIVKIYDISGSTYTNTQTITSSSSDLFGYSLDINHEGDRFVVSESIAETYHVYDLSSVSGTWSSDISLSTYDPNVLRYNNSVSMSGLGDVVFIGETDPDGTEEGIVFGYYLDASSTWSRFSEISGNFLSTIDGSNSTQTDISFGSDDSFGSSVKMNTLGTHIMIKSNSYNNIDERSFIVLKFSVGDGVTAPTLSEVVESVDDLANLDVDASEIVSSGFTTEELKDAGVDADTMLTGGATESDLLNAGFSIDDIASASSDLSSLVGDSSTTDITEVLAAVPLTDLLSKNVDISDVLTSISSVISSTSASGEEVSIDFSAFKDAGIPASSLKSAGIPASKLKEASFSPSELVSAGFSVTELAEAEISATDLKGVGLPLTDLVDAFDPEDLVQAAFDDSDFEAAGFTVVEPKTVSKTIGGIEIAQEVKPIFKNDDISDLSTDMPEVDDLEKMLNENPDVGAVLTVKAQDADGNTISDLSNGPIVLTLDLPNLDPTVQNYFYKFDDSYNIMNPQPDGYPVTLNYNESTGKYTATLTKLSTIGGSAQTLSKNNYLIYLAHDSLESGSYTNEKYHQFLVFVNGMYKSSWVSSGIREQNNIQIIDPDATEPLCWNTTNIASSSYYYYNFSYGSISDSFKNSDWYTSTLQSAINKSTGDTWYWQSIGAIVNTIEIEEEGEMYIESIPDTMYLYYNGNSLTQRTSITDSPLTFTLYYDITPPVITISCEEIESGSYTNKSSFDLTIELSEIVTNFELASFTTTNCSVSSFTQIDDLSYSCTVVPNNEGYCALELPLNTITDRAGNLNDVSSNFSFNYDITPPTFTITSSTVSSGDTTNDSYIVMQITPSEILQSFTKSIIQIENGDTFGSLVEDNGVYTISVKPSVTTSTTVSVYIAANTVQDLAGNYNDVDSDKFVWNYDKVPPVATISSSTIEDAEYSAHEYIDLSFTITEEVENFDISSVTVTNGYLSEFSGSGASYSAKAYPDISSEAADITFDIASGAFTDIADNDNTVSEQFTWKYDPLPPVVDIVTTIESGLTTSDAYIEFDVSCNKEITNMSTNVFTVTNGYVGDITGADNLYSAKLYPTGTDQVSVYIDVDQVSDVAGNTNDNSSNEFTWTFDGSSPIISMNTSDLDSNSSTTETSITVYLNNTDTSTTVTASDFTVSEYGTISSFTQDSTTGVYSFVFSTSTPNVENSVYVAAGAIEDSAGNTNPKSNTIKWTFSKSAPTMVVSHMSYESGSLNNVTSIDLSFTASESVSDFTSDSIDISNGTVTYLSGSDADYVATIVPSDLNSKSTISVYVPAYSFSDVYSIQNSEDTNTFSWTYDPIVPTIDITSDDVTSGDSNNSTSIQLIFTFSKEVTSFAASNLSITNATVTDISGSGTTYTAVLTPDTVSATDKVTTKVVMPADSIEDLAGNKNEEESNEFIWTYDGGPPTIEIYSTDMNSGDTNNNDSIDLVFSASKDITNFTASDVIVSNGTIDTLTGSGSLYYSTLTVSSDLSGSSGEVSAYVDTSSFIDSAGNLNDSSSNTFIWNYDDEPVTLTITETNDISNNSTTNDDYLTFEITSSKEIDYYLNENLSITNGSAFSFNLDASTNTKLTFNVSPTESNTTVTVTADAGFIVSTLGKSNTEATETFTWTYDGDAPIITFSSPTIENGAVISIQDISMEIAISEVPLSFSVSDIAVTNGTITNFSGSDTSYNFDLSVTSEGTVKVYIPTDNSITDAAANVSVPYNAFEFTYDTTNPIVSISHATNESGFTSNESYIDLSINVSKNTSISTNSINVTNGTKSNFSENDTNEYSIRIFPKSGVDYTQVSVNIPADIITDDAGLKNESDASFSWIYNNNVPTMAITSSIADGAYSNDASFSFSFLASEDIVDFTSDSITVTNASVSDFDGSGSSYTMTVTPSSTGLVSLFVDAGSVQNLAGNVNTEYAEFSFTSDQEDVTCEITGSITSDISSEDTSVTLTIVTNKSVTLSEIISGLNGNVTNGSLTDISGSGKTYTATLLPTTANTTTSVLIPANSLTDSAGNTNTSDSNTFSWTYIGNAPTITLSTTNTFRNGSESKDATISVTATLSGTGTLDLSSNDVSYNNGSISNFVNTDTNVYTFDFTAETENEVAKVFVPASTIEDEYSVGNIVSNTISYTFDDTTPTMTISSSDISSGDKSNLSFINIDFVASEEIESFDNDKIDVSNATLSTITTSDNVTFSGILTPTISEGAIYLQVGSEKFTDVVGNWNDNSSNEFVWNYDSTIPTITISSDDQESGVTSNLASIELKFTLSEEVVSFTTENIEVTNGSITNLTGSGTEYTATLSPINTSTISVRVPAGSISDETGNSNESASNTFTWTFDSDQPIITITGDTIVTGSKTTDQQITVYFSVSDTTATLTKSNITRSNASVVSFAQTSSDPLEYTAILSSSSEGSSSSIQIAADEITDDGGNGNIATEVFEWTYDTTLPVISITSDDMTSGDANNLSSISITFSSDEDLNDFTITDINKTNCSIGDFTQVSTKEFTATVTPTNEGEILIYIPQGSITDDAGNENELTTSFVWNYDGTSPIIILTADEVVSGQYYDSQKINMTATITNESSLTLQTSDFSVTGGSIVESSFTQDSSSVYTFELKATTSGTESSISIPENTIYDDASNGNIGTSEFTWTYDASELTYTITTSDVDDSGYTNTEDVKFVITFSESVATFKESSLELTNCVVKSFTGSATDSYTVTITATENSTASIEIPSATIVTMNAISKTIADASYNWTYDTTNPTVTLSSNDQASGTTSNKEYVDIDIKSSEDLLDFTENDISVTGNASLSNFDGSGSEYSVRVTPTSTSDIIVSVNANTASDLAGNLNESKSSFEWSFDNTSPTITINAGSVNGSTASTSPIDISFVLSKEVESFKISNITATNCSITNLDGSGTFYTAEVVPSVNGNISVIVATNEITDSAGNSNDTSSNEISFTFSSDDILASITSDDVENDGSSKSETVTMTLTLSEPPYSGVDGIQTTSFDVSNGTVSNISTTDSSSVFTFDFTSTNELQESSVMLIAQEVIGQSVNSNLESNTYSWTYDATPPTIAITSSTVESEETTNDDTIDVIFTATEDISGFDASSVTLTNATINSFTGNGSEYTATITPTVTSDQINISVDIDTFEDSVGNRNTSASNTFIWYYDAETPEITISSDEVTEDEELDASYVTFTFTSTKSLGNMSSDKITLKNASIFSITEVSNKIYTVVIEATDRSADKTVSLQVDTDKVSDTVGNSNKNSSNTFSFIIQKLATSVKEPSEVVDSLQSDLGIDFTSLGIDETEFSDELSAVFTTDINEGDTLSIPTNVSGMTNSSIFNMVIDQMLLRNSGVTKVKIAKDDIPFSDVASEILGTREDIQVAPSNTSVNFTDYVPTSEKESAAFYCPISNIDDYIEIVIEDVTYTITKTDTSTFSFQRGTANAVTANDDDSFTIDGYTFVFGSVSVTNNNTDEDPNADTTEETVELFIPCFREGTKVLTNEGYVAVEDLKDQKLIDDHGRELELLRTKRFTKPYDGKTFPYVVPKGSKLSEDFTCTEDLHITHNHCIYLPHINKYIAPWRMNMPQDKREVNEYVFYHVYTENYFSDVIIANGIPCETISDPVMENKIFKHEYPRELQMSILNGVLNACGYDKRDGSRDRMTRKQFNKVVHRIKSKWGKRQSKK